MTCRCIGAHRTFSPVTGRCVCQSGYVFFDEASLEESEENNDVDCLPKVRGRLYCTECTQLIIQVLPLFNNYVLIANQFTLLCSIPLRPEGPPKVHVQLCVYILSSQMTC